MPKKTKPPTLHPVPFAFIKAAETYLPSAILESDTSCAQAGQRPIAIVFAAAKENKEVARGLIAKAIDEIQVLEEKRKLKLMMGGELDPADNPLAVEMIVLLKQAMTGKVVVAVESIKTCLASEVPQTKPKRVIASPAPQGAATPKKIITLTPGAIPAPAAPMSIADDANFAKFAKLKVRLGSDTFSMMILPRLLAALGDAATDTQREIEALWEQRNEVDSEEYQLSFDDRALSCVLRWHLRGLNISSAVKKTRVDYQIHKEKQARKEAACQISQNPVSSS